MKPERRRPELRREGEILGERYRLMHLLGEGGMGAVYEAEHLETGRRVAVKLLHPELARDDAMLARFRREARAAARLTSEHVTAVLDLGDAEDGTPYLVLELLQGETLRQLLAREGRLPLVRVARLGVQACHALAEAHAGGVVHRDLKPENLFVIRRSDDSDSLKLLDFGVAKLSEASGVSTRAGAMVGTVLYMSPEQARGSKDLDARSDVYSLAAIVYEALAGRPPHASGEQHAVVYRILHERITPLAELSPELPAPVCRLVDRSLAREREQRPRDVREIARVLERYCGGPAMARAADQETLGSVVASPARKRRLWPLVVGATLITLGLVASWDRESGDTRADAAPPAPPAPAADPPRATTPAVAAATAEPTPSAAATASRKVPPVALPSRPTPAPAPAPSASAPSIRERVPLGF